MISIDAVLLGALVVGVLAMVPLGIAAIGLLVWGTRPSGRGQRRAAN